MIPEVERQALRLVPIPVQNHNEFTKVEICVIMIMQISAIMISFRRTVAGLSSTATVLHISVCSV